MQKKYTLAGIAVITLMLVITLGYFYNNHDGVTGTPSVNPALLPYKEQLKTVYQNKTLDEEEKKAQVKQIINTLPQPYRRQYQVALSSLPDINFYGRIIDQYGQPVVNAGVWQNGGSAYLRGGGGQGYAGTDEEGYFAIETHGAFLEIGGVKHPEIDYVNHPPQEPVSLYFYNSKTRFETPSGANIARRNELYYTDYKTKEKAFIIKAWRLQGYEGAKEGNYRFIFKSDGRPYTIKLDEYETRQRSNLQTEGETEGDLRVSCTRDAYVEATAKRKDLGDWHLSITPVNGGIQASDDLYMNMAPEVGYQPALVIDMKKGTNDYKYKLQNQRYYFKTNKQGKEQYGLLYVDIQPFRSENECGLNIKTFRYNPTGSRNLEMLRDKTSMPELPDQNAPQRIEVASR